MYGYCRENLFCFLRIGVYSPCLYSRFLAISICFRITIFLCARVFFFLQPNKLIRLSLSRLKDYFAFSCETNYLNLHNNANFTTNDSRQRKYTGKLCSFYKLHLKKVLSQVMRWCLTEVA